MRVSFITGYGVPKFSILFRPHGSCYLCRPICSSSTSALTTSQKPRTPLFLRPPTQSATLSDLQKWQNWAKNLASSVGSTFVDLDNGPDSTLLRRELKWLVEDVTEDGSISAEQQRNIRLRVSLEELYKLWKQRIEEKTISVYYNQGLREGLWADMGTGTGAIAIGIGMILRSYGRIIATDLSPGSWRGFQCAEAWSTGKLAGIVSNPPYIPSDHISGLQAEVGRHEPKMALDGGVNGMNDLLHLCKGAASMLKPGGFLAFETNGEKQCKHLVEYMETNAGGIFCDVNLVPDFAGVHRFVTAFHK
ncbi:hypothetical protein FNV43_RR14030 [Rhamnella rubrinervis]|uniref:Uncharacterized protein n=1 Tax=Rhamnella rubrinervis TaxID=2594499 RepID=A0A8K0H292_9ROSA|nr:hypothetical protein FNV43_RR14030 [Rhamnella rubrinervis]